MQNQRLHRVGSILALSAAVLLTMSCGGSSPTPTSTSPTASTGDGTSSGGGSGPYDGGGTSSGGGTTPSGSADVVITIVGINGNMSFSPASATVKVGQTVAWKNADSITHDVVQDVQGGFAVGFLTAGATSTPIMMSQAGTFPYHCMIHPVMVGTLTVTQ